MDDQGVLQNIEFLFIPSMKSRVRATPNIAIRRPTSTGSDIVANNHFTEDYAEWNRSKSTTVIKSLVDNSMPANTKAIASGMAKIADDLLRHQHAATEIYYVTKGRAILHLGDELITLEPGMVVYLPSGVPHFTETIGDEPLEILFVFAKDSLKNVGYDYDEITRISTLPSRVVTLEGAQQGRDPIVRTIVQETDPIEQGLKLDHIQIPKKKVHSAKSDLPTKLFVRSGSGRLIIDGQTVTLLEGSFVYIPEGIPYRIIAGDNAIDVLSFNPLPPKP